MVDHDTAETSDLMPADPPDVQATFCATLVDQWLRLGVRHAVIAPGSRSTPMALALACRPDMSVHVVHDERVAAFTALGLGLEPGPGVPATPALLLCTSGTAAANFLPAVVEAGLSEIPMIVLTADRPEELRGVGAPQTIDQIELYGRHVRWFHDAGVADASSAREWRQLAVTAWSRSATGPVHLNLPFREPLVGTARSLPAPGEPTVEGLDDGPTDPVPDSFDAERGVILVGGRHGVDEGKIVELHGRTAWPIIADPTSGLRHLSTVTTIDGLLRNETFADEWRPDTIVRIGRPSASKVLAQWTARPDVTLVQVGGPGRIDPAHNVAAVCSIDDLLATGPTGASGSTWLAGWHVADERAEHALVDWFSSAPGLSEPAAARTLAEHLPPGSQLTVSSSMPVRDLEWFGGRAAYAHCNRGANGIDGVISTALGRALARGHGAPPAFVLIGDLAFVHDSNALVALDRRAVDLRIVVVDNDGGGIFSFLPQSSSLDHERFEQLFGTPLGTDVLALAAAHGLATATATTRDQLVSQIGRPGPWVCRVSSNREENVRVHEKLNDAIIQAAGGSGPR
jgi:2-succinyl-5-enolpyruvyl-6-hydroxy-3-cyclohexene-1-carboxylate synthase